MMQSDSGGCEVQSISKFRAAAAALAAALLSACATPVTNETPVGTWQQVDPRCFHPIRELVFRPDGTFLMTWTPFETYWDYVGEWTYDVRSRRLEMRTTGRANYIPEDIDLSGRATIVDGVMTLEDMTLGSRQRGAICAQVFARMGATRSGG